MFDDMPYVVGHADQLCCGEVKGIRLLGRELVIFRDERGELGALDDACIHRGARLSTAKRVTRGCVECPYHGWQFDAQGRCRHVPSQPERSPDRVVATHAYRVYEAHGFLWVAPSTRAQPVSLELPELEATGFRVTRGEFEYDAPWWTVVTNAVDPAHTAFVHGSWMSQPGGPPPEVRELTRDEWSGSVSVLYPPPQWYGVWKLMKLIEKPTRVDLAFHLPGLVQRVRLKLSDAMEMRFVVAFTPLDERTTRANWVCARNFMRTPLMDGYVAKSQHKTFEEDRRVLSGVRLGFEEALERRVSAEIDALDLHIRRCIRRWAARSGEHAVHVAGA